VSWYSRIFDWVEGWERRRREGGGGMPRRSHGTFAGLGAVRPTALRTEAARAARLRQTGLWRLAERLYQRLGLEARMRWLGIAWTVPNQGVDEAEFTDGLWDEFPRHGFQAASIDSAIWAPALGAPERPVCIASHWGTISYVFVRSFGRDLYVGLHTFIRIMPGLTPLVVATVFATAPLLFVAISADFLPSGAPRWGSALIFLFSVPVAAGVFVVLTAVFGRISLSARTLRGPGVAEADDYQMVVNSLVSLIEGQILKRAGEGDEATDLARVLRREWLYSTPSQASFPLAPIGAAASGADPASGGGKA